MNISVSNDLRARILAVEHPPNWSAIACAAFEKELDGKLDIDERLDAIEKKITRLTNRLQFGLKGKP